MQTIEIKEKVYNVYENDDIIDLISTLDFDPAYFLGKEIISIDDLISVAENFYNDGRLSIRYSNDDLCFEINFSEYTDANSEKLEDKNYRLVENSLGKMYLMEIVMDM